MVDDHAGEAHVDLRTRNPTKRLRADEVAIIDHSDIDRVSAEALVTCNPLAVVNAAKLASGRYSSLGPGILSAAGAPLVNDCRPEVMEVGEGTRVHVTKTGEVYAREELVATGTIRTAETIAANQEDVRADTNVQLRVFAMSTIKYVEHEQDLIFDDVGVSGVKASFGGRHVLVVIRGYRYKKDPTTLCLYIREYGPIMVGVDGGADAIFEKGYKLDMIVGDMDSVSGRAPTYGAKIVVHTYRDGCTPGSKRVDELEMDHVVFPYTGTSEDVAVLLADGKGAELIIALDTHNTPIEFLDRGRPEMASTFLTRLAVGGKLIDTKGVSQLYHSRVSNWQIFALLLAGCIAIGAAMTLTATGRTTFELISARFGNIPRWFGLFF